MNKKKSLLVVSTSCALVCLFLYPFYITLGQSAAKDKSEFKIAKYFYKKLDGRLGDKRIEFDLMRFGSSLEGHFYFLEEEEKGTILGTISESGRISLEEIEGVTETGEPNVVGLFEGKFMSPTEIAGTWHSIDGNEYSTFELRETYPEGAANFWVVHEGRSYSGTATVDLIYVVMGDEKYPKAAQKINAYINGHILNYDHPTSDRKQFGDHSDFLDDFVARYKKAAEQARKDGMPMPIWDNHHQIILDYNNHNIVVLEFVESVLEGAAVSKESVHFVNFNIETGEKIELQDIFVEGFEKTLAEKAEEIFRSKYGFKNIKSFAEEGFAFKDDKFALNNNFALSKGGITFRFNTGEIAATSMGALEIFIPYSELQSVIVKKSCLQAIMENHY